MRDQLVTSQLVAHWLRNWLHSWSPLSNVDNTKVVHANMLRNVSKHQSKLFLRSGGIHSCILVLFGRSVSLVALVTSTGCTGYITGRAGYISWSRWLHPLVALVTSAGRAGYITGRTGYINWLHWLHNWLHSWLPLLNVDNTKVVHANMIWNVSKHQSRLFLRSGGIHSRIL